MFQNFQNIKILDLLFRYTNETLLDTMIAECGLNYNNILLNHVGLYIGNDNIIEANKEGVVINTLETFIKGKIYIKRVAINLSDLEIASIITKAKSYLNKEYNTSYKDDSNTIYCSDLIIKAFEILKEKSPFKRHPITFNNHRTAQLDTRWLDFYNNNPSNIPEGQLGSHPASLFKNQSLKLIN